ncbi:MAG: lysophospholipid acyltransferase family protein [Minisyncoccia bacterium]
MKRNSKETSFFWTLLIGLSIWLYVLVLILLRKVTVKGWMNLPLWKTRNIFVFNHRYTGEEIYVNALLGHQFLIRPRKCGPHTYADKKNYYDNPRFRLMRPNLIPVDRTAENGNLASLLTGINILKSGGNINIFPEGHRTAKGSAFLTSKNAERISIPFMEGFACLAMESGATLRPVWVDVKSTTVCGFPFIRKAKFVVGKPIDISALSREQIVRKTERTLIELADQA